MAPIVRSLQSYVKDSQHALQIFRDFNFLGEDKLIFTLHIASLSTVTPNDEDLPALKIFFDPNTTPPGWTSVNTQLFFIRGQLF